MKAQIKRKRASSASLFLMELMVAILFFTLSASVCVTLFVRAHIQSEKAKALNHALNICSDAAEIVRTSQSISDTASHIGSVYEYAVRTGDSSTYEISIYFNDNYLPTPQSSIAKVETVKLTETDSLLSADISFADSNGEEIYHMNVVHAKELDKYE